MEQHGITTDKRGWTRFGSFDLPRCTNAYFNSTDPAADITTYKELERVRALTELRVRVGGARIIVRAV